MKNNFKKIVLGLMGVLLMSITSCSEENVLNLSPYNQADENSAFSSKSLIELSVNGVYNAAQVGYYGGAPRGYPFGAAYFQQNDARGEDVVNTAAFYQYTYESTYNPTGSLNNIYYWEDTYKLINKCNLVIEGVTDAIAKGVVTQAEGDVYLGQVLFFRAWSHFELMKHFSRPYDHTADGSHMAVPYLTIGSKNSETALANANTDRGTVKDAYAKVLQDLNDSETKLASQPKSILRVSKYAAIALKSRVYMNMKRWADVITEANKLDGVYKLESNPNNPFSAPRNNTESIFSLDQSATNNPGVNAALASQYNGRRLLAISPIIWNDPAWSGVDARRSVYKQFYVTVGSDGKDKTVEQTVDPNGILIMVSGKDRTVGTYYTGKYKDTSTYSDPSPLLRYAEVLLNRAEAKARLGDGTYLADLNTVRGRSTANVYTAFASPKEAVNAIIKEKRIEFLAEGMRWQDIHRLQNDNLVDYDGIPAKYPNGTPKPADYVIGAGYTIKTTDLQGIPYSDFRFLWPIPARETSVNPKMAEQQNPGW